MRDFRDAKAMAHTLRAALAELGLKITIGQSLELTAKAFGVADWNTLSALIGADSGTPVAPTAPDDQIAHRRHDQTRPRQAVAFEPSRFDRYVGFYRLSNDALFTITRRGAQFYVELTGQATYEVFPESDSKFFYKVVPAQISFTTSRDGSAPALILHQNGLEQRAERVEERVAKALSEGLAERVRENRPAAGTEQALRKLLAALESDAPVYDDMSPSIAALFRQQWPGLKATMPKWGPLRSISFKRVGSGGNDQYDVVFQNTAMVWTVGLDADGKVSTAGVSA